MSEILKSWALGLCAVSLLSAAAQAAAGRSRQTAGVRFAEAMAAALVILAPLRGGAVILPELRPDPGTALTGVQAEADRLTARQVEEYIEAEAAARGIDCRACAECETADGAFFLRTLRLEYGQTVTDGEKEAFTREMAQAFRLDAAVQEAYP